MRYAPPRKPAIAIAAAALLLNACGSDAAPSSGAAPELTVVATTTILGDVVAQIVGDDALVEVLLPIGASPHDYRASSQQVASLQAADLVVANGLHLEESLEDILETASQDGANVYEIGPDLEPVPFVGDDHEHANDGLDPHVWLDPLRMADAVNLIVKQLERIDSSTDWQARADTYVAELLETDQQIRDILSSIPDNRRKIVTNHGSLGYFASRYDFEVIGVVIPGGSTLAEPSSAELTALVNTIEQEGVTAIFGDTTESMNVAEAVAAENGESIEVVELYTGSLGEPGSGAETLIEMLLSNATAIAAALS